MFERLKTIFKGKDAGAAARSRTGDSVLSRVAGPDKKPVPLAPSDDSVRAPQTPTPPAMPPPMPGAGAGAASAQARPAPQAPADVKPQKSPEEVCGITSKMSKDEVRARLAFLYRRYNRATSSLDAKLRHEADEMLDAVVVVREKVFGAI